FSSRRRHTRWPRDWSSDVCSSDLRVVLVGDPAQVEPSLAAAGGPHERIELFPCTQVVGMEESPVEALRRKPDNSITRCWQLLAQIGRASCRERVSLAGGAACA